MTDQPILTNATTTFIKIDNYFNCELLLPNGNKFIIPMREDGYIFATALCKASNKRLTLWKTNKDTQIYLNRLSTEVGIPTSVLIEIKKGGKNIFHQGTWVHPDLGVHLAQWCCPDFALQVSRWVRELIITGKVEQGNEKKEQELQEAFEKIKKQLEAKEEELNNQQDYIKRLENKVLRKQKPKVQYKDKNVIYMVQDEYHKRDRIYVIGKAINLNNRLNSYNKSRDHEAVYYKSCNSAQQMELIEKCVLYKLDKYREVGNRDRFILPLDQEITLFSSVIDSFVEMFNDVSPEVDITCDYTDEDFVDQDDDAKQNYNEDHKEDIKEYQDIYQKQYREENKDDIKLKHKMYRDENKEIISEKNNKYRETHKDEILFKAKKYKETNKEEISIKATEYYHKNKKSLREKKKAYKETNKSYYQKNKEEITRKIRLRSNKDGDNKITCECGLKVCKSALARHQKSEIHFSFLKEKSSNENTNIPITELADMRVECKCGIKVVPSALKRHQKSKLHDMFLNAKNKEELQQLPIT
jgi:hypothetical protein